MSYLVTRSMICVLTALLINCRSLESEILVQGNCSHLLSAPGAAFSSLSLSLSISLATKSVLHLCILPQLCLPDRITGEEHHLTGESCPLLANF